MRVAIFSDTHIHPFSMFSSVHSSGMNSRVMETLSAMERMYSWCVENGITDVFCAGDLFHSGERVQTEVFNTVSRFFERWKDRVKTVLVGGNHDVGNLGESILFGLRNDVDEIVLGEPRMKTYPDCHVLFVPYTTHYADLPQTLAEFVLYDNAAPHIVVGHLALEGAVVGQHEYRPPEGCSPRLFRHATHSFFGHYHKMQAVGEGVMYVGSLVARDFSEAEEPKGFLAVTIGPGPDGVTIEHIRVRSTGFVILDLDATPLCDVLPERFNQQVVRVDYSGEVDEGKVTQVLTTMGATLVVFNKKSTRKVEVRVATPEGSPPPSLNDYIRVYVEKNGEGFDPTKLVEVGNDIVKRVHGKVSHAST
jgi:DNA repair exonuclease SbcCD nuclease subunit